MFGLLNEREKKDKGVVDRGVNGLWGDGDVSLRHQIERDLGGAKLRLKINVFNGKIFCI